MWHGGEWLVVLLAAPLWGVAAFAMRRLNRFYCTLTLITLCAATLLPSELIRVLEAGISLETVHSTRLVVYGASPWSFGLDAVVLVIAGVVLIFIQKRPEASSSSFPWGRAQLAILVVSYAILSAMAATLVVHHLDFASRLTEAPSAAEPGAMFRELRAAMGNTRASHSCARSGRSS